MHNVVLYSFTFIIEAFILWQYTSTLFYPKYSAKTRLFTLSSFYLLLFLFSLFNLKFLNLLLYCITNFIYLVSAY